MGLTFVEATVTGSTDKQRHVPFSVDSGASYTLLPLDVWHDLGLEPKRKVTFVPVSRTHIGRRVSPWLNAWSFRVRIKDYADAIVVRLRATN